MEAPTQETHEKAGVGTPIAVAVGLVVVLAGVAYWFDLRIAALGLLAVILGSVVPLVCLLGGNAADRQKRLFNSLEDKALGQTAYAEIAQQYFQSISRERLLRTRGFRLPIGFLTVLVFLFALAALFGGEFKILLETPNLFLGGIKSMSTPPVEAADLAEYQGITLLTVSMSALGAYVIVVLRLVKRVYNSDIDPISFYFFSIHMLQAVIVAAVVRHLLPALPGVEADPAAPIFAGLGFAIGLQPDIFMNFVAGWARERFNIASSPRQAEPDEDLRPTNLSLSMLEGMTKEKRARFGEMGIDNSQGLAEYNPYVLWARTAFQMQQILDWIAQAQLYVVVKEDGLKRLRPYGIRDIFGLVTAAKSDAAQELANVLDMDIKLLKATVVNLHHDSSYTRLLEVREVLRGKVAGESGETGGAEKPGEPDKPEESDE